MLGLVSQNDRIGDPLAIAKADLKDRVLPAETGALAKIVIDLLLFFFVRLAE